MFTTMSPADMTEDPDFAPRTGLPDVLAAIREVGYDRWLIVELDSYDGDPVEAARISRSYLDKVLG